MRDPRHGNTGSVWVDFLNGAIVAFTGVAAALAAAGLVFALAWKRIAAMLIRPVTNILLSDRYEENVFEMAAALRRVSPQVVVEMSLRAESGKVIHRPLGSPHRFLSFDGLMFRSAQLARLPTADDAQVDLSVVIGPSAARPLRIDIPILISGMASGLHLSERAKVALARAADAVGTATNTGRGPWLESERAATRRLILQYGRDPWAKEPEILTRADMIEIGLGTGAWAGAGGPDAAGLRPEVARLVGMRPGDIPVLHARLPELQRPHHLKRVVERLREQAGGVPVGVKIAPGEDLELDLEVALEAGVDFVTVDGAQGATAGSPPILQDDFGLPTLHLVARAARFLEERGLKGRVSLIASGGLWVPGDFLKAIALGADAVALGTILLLALAHNQLGKVIPWEPPTQLVLGSGRYSDRLDVDLAARSVENLLRACARELELGLRALGKTRITDVNRHDLVATDRETADAAGVPLTARPS